ncbi:outer membrane beta-barrel protein [Flavobacterium sp. MK4S-17]|jgi:hypothetical protein|uniref:outer membrane beta-barrel protein n=1 Tax=Flavobacterium sp. MK4S-17 TaxID=2543737 RepID=UPI001358022B|nr:outer membrane beta-barrel protein [Flavobacterium sp. MK4S-17]
MKKILLSAVALMAFGFANAQEETTGKGFSQGDVFISGSLNFTSEKTGDFKTNGIIVSPRAAYFVDNNIAVGLSLGFASSKGDVTEEGDTFEVKTTAFEIGAFGRYYFTPANDFSLFGQLNVAYATAKTEVDVVDTEVKVNGINIGVAPGISYFVSDHFALEATFGILGYTTVKPDFDGADSTDTFQIGLDLSDINFGVVYKF